MSVFVVVMGVAGSGKSAVGRRLADLLGLALIEGDEFHPAGNVEKMRRGLALDDQDRSGWLQRLGQEMARHPGGAVLACSALKRAYRDSLRSAVPGLRFIHLELSQAQAQQRVAQRGGHFYPPSLVASQFEALQDPRCEPGVWAADAALPVGEVARQAAEWIAEAGLAGPALRKG